MAIAALKARRSIRCYEPDYVIPKEDMEKILDAAINTPSALNCQELDLVVVTNKERIQKVNDVVYDILDPSVQQRYIDRQKRYGVSQKIMYDASALILIVKNERASGQEKVDAGMMAMSIIAAAQDLGLSTVPLGIIVRPQVEEMFGLAPGSLMLGVGIGKAKSTDVDKKENRRKITFVE